MLSSIPLKKISSHSLTPKQDTLDEISIEDNSTAKKFYLSEILVIITGYTNSLQSFLQNPSSPVPLIISSIFQLFVVLISIVLYKSNNVLNKQAKFIYPLFFLFTGLGIVITDVDLLNHLSKISAVSYYPSLLQLILRAALQSSVQAPINLNIITVCLGIISLSVRAITLKPIQESFYLLSVLSIICLKFGYKRNIFRKISISTHEKYLPATQGLDWDYSEIIAQMKISINSLSGLNESLQNMTCKRVIQNLEKIWLNLKKNKNIYSSNFEHVTKNMDDQDREFIQQSCFIGIDKMMNNLRYTSHIQEKSNFSYGVNELTGPLSMIGKNWNFNTFFISTCSNKEPIRVMGLFAIRKFGLDDLCNVGQICIENFLVKIESSYKNNPYHNSTHGADVMASYLYLMSNSDIIKHSSATELLSGIVATLAHDAGHPGKTNRFLIMTRDDVAMVYNDISVLENMHASILFNILKNEETNILKNFPSDKFFVFRKCVIDMVLATDMTKHFDLMAQFRVKYYESDNVNLDVQETRHDLFKIIMKAADIGHAAKSLELHEKWCKLVIEEFYEQGDMEKDLGINVSMYCDRENTDISKSQAGFIKNIVQPLFVNLNSILLSPDIEKDCLDQLRKNEMFWVLRRKTIRGQSLITRNEEYVNKRNSLVEGRKSIRKPSLPEETPEKKVLSVNA